MVIVSHIDSTLLLYTEVDFVGHVVSRQGIYMQNDLKTAILDWPTPASIKAVEQFIGLANYYRKFMKGYASILRPISDIL